MYNFIVNNFYEMDCFVGFLYVCGILVYVELNNDGRVLMMDVQILMNDCMVPECD